MWESDLPSVLRWATYHHARRILVSDRARTAVDTGRPPPAGERGGHDSCADHQLSVPYITEVKRALLPGVPRDTFAHSVHCRSLSTLWAMALPNKG